MTARTVRSQAELGAALADAAVTHVVIDAPPTEVIDIRATGDTVVDIAGNSQVGYVYGSAQVGSVSGSAQVGYVSDSAQVRSVYGSAQVRYVYGSAQVGSAGPRTLIGRYSKTATITSRGRVIDFTDDVIPDHRDTAAWLDENGLTPDPDGTVVLYKAVGADLRSHNGDRPTYTPGTTLTAPDWRDDHECGGGLHVSPNVFQAEACSTGTGARYLRVRVVVADIRGIGFEKCKVRTLVVEAEVDSFGDDLAVTA